MSLPGAHPGAWGLGHYHNVGRGRGTAGPRVLKGQVRGVMGCSLMIILGSPWGVNRAGIEISFKRPLRVTIIK